MRDERIMVTRVLLAARQTKAHSLKKHEAENPAARAKMHRPHGVRPKVCSQTALELTNHFLQVLKYQCLDLLACRLGLERHRLLGEWIDAFTRFGGRFLNNLQLYESGNGKYSVAT